VAVVATVLKVKKLTKQQEGKKKKGRKQKQDHP